MPRTAALLCIHDASPTLGWWIAHHIAVGFSALLICNDLQDPETQDPETVQTRSLLAHASSLYDVRILDCDTLIEDKTQRRETGIRTLLSQNREEFSWVLPLALDEYFLPEGNSVQDFLTVSEEKIGQDTFAGTPLLPVNWCICGLNSQKKPATSILHNASPRALYTHHAPEDFPDHRITRSFFRPTHFHDDLPSPFACLNKEPDWSLGRILHDAASCSDGTAQVYYDRNDVPFKKGMRFLKASQNIVAKLFQAQLLGLVYTLRTNAPAIASNAQPASLTRSYLGYNNAFLVLNHATQALTWRPGNCLDSTKETCLCLAYEASSTTSASQAAWLYPEMPLPWPFLTLRPAQQRVMSDFLEIVPLRLHRNDKGASLSYSLHDEALAFPGTDHITLVPLPETTPMTPPFMALVYLARYGLTLENIHSALPHMPWPSPSAFGAVLAQYLNHIADNAEPLASVLHTLFRPAALNAPISNIAESPLVFRPA